MASFIDKVKGTFTPYAVAASNKANKKAEEFYPANEQHNARGDAYRHLVWQALVTRNKSKDYAERVGNIHEWPIPVIGAGFDQPSEEKQMDLYNNSLGRSIGLKAKSEEDIYRMAKEAIDKGKAKYIPVEELDYRALIERMSSEQESPY
jgi:hypothetical protein